MKQVKNCWKQWLKAAAIRAIRTMAQTAAAILCTSAVLSEVDWLMVGSSTLLAGLLSLVNAVAGLPEVQLPEIEV